MIRGLITTLLAVSMTTSGCATLLNTSPSQLTINAEPATATNRLVRDDGQTTTLTGGRNTIALDRHHNYVLTASQAGRQEQSVAIGRQVAPAFWGNLAILATGIAVLVLPGLRAFDSSGLSAGLSIGLLLPIALIGGAGAGAIDGLTGAMWDHAPTNVSLTLPPEPPLAP